MFTKRFSKPFIVAVIIVAALLTASFGAFSAATSSAHIADHSYDMVEQVRSERSVTGNVAADRSYDTVESLRVNRAFGVAADRGYDQVEQIRIERNTYALVPVTGENAAAVRSASLEPRLWSGAISLSDNSNPDLTPELKATKRQKPQSACMSEDSLPHRQSGCIE